MKFTHKLLTAFFFSFLLNACASHEPPAKITKAFFSEIQEGNIRKAAELVNTDHDMREELILDILELREFTQGGGGIESIEIRDVSYNPDKTEATVSSKVSVKREINGEKSYLDEFTLKKIDGQWKIWFSKYNKSYSDQSDSPRF